MFFRNSQQFRIPARPIYRYPPRTAIAQCTRLVYRVFSLGIARHDPMPDDNTVGVRSKPFTLSWYGAYPITFPASGITLTSVPTGRDRTRQSVRRGGRRSKLAEPKERGFAFSTDNVSVKPISTSAITVRC